MLFDKELRWGDDEMKQLQIPCSRIGSCPSLSLCIYALNQHQVEETKIITVCLTLMGSKTSKNRESDSDQVSKKKISSGWTNCCENYWSRLCDFTWWSFPLLLVKFLLTRFSAKNCWWKMPIINWKDADIVNETRWPRLIRLMVSIGVYLKDAAHADNIRTKEKLSAKTRPYHDAPTSNSAVAMLVFNSRSLYNWWWSGIFNPSDIIEDTEMLILSLMVTLIPHSKEFLVC